MNSRRRFLAGAAVTPFAAVSATAPAAPPLTESISLNGPWRFRPATTQDWQTITVPHTWQTSPDLAGHYGAAEYERTFFAPAEWATGAALRIRFEAVFHSATVTINGKPAGEHLRKGYTPFTIDVHKLLRFGQPNTLHVKVDNAFDETMLPRGRSSDWAHDGGIYRPVTLLVTPSAFIERLEIDAVPQSAGASITARAILRNTAASTFSGSLTATVDNEAASATAVCAIPANGTSTIPVTLKLDRANLWHFDHPNLYTLRATLSSGHQFTDRFGIRTIETRDNAFFLNGDRVRLMGVERMAGSNPEFGMAEPLDWILHDHADMRALNCIYTRVHWPQDRRILDWCDEHGMLIQTEVPAWGPKTFAGMKDEPDPEILNNGLQQLCEMIADARNHPCIFSWGLCNEINGQNPPAKAFTRAMYKEAKRLDPTRLATYASHSLFKTPQNDVAGELDYVMFNEYYGSWQTGTPDDLAGTLDEIHRVFPNKAIVISEYGYCACTASRPEDDAKRTGILTSHDAVLKSRPWIAGLIFFCYNDYRTHVGDKGVGALKQRVHGVVDLYGVRKPSWDQLRRESSPAQLTLNNSSVTIEVSSTVPAYTLCGYKLRVISYGDGNIPFERTEKPLPNLAPGQKLSTPIRTGTQRTVADLLRPTGESVATADTGPLTSR